MAHASNYFLPNIQIPYRYSAVILLSKLSKASRHRQKNYPQHLGHHDTKKSHNTKNLTDNPTKNPKVNTIGLAHKVGSQNSSFLKLLKNPNPPPT